MRIIGGHDYYDSGMAWGRDDAVTFLRNGDRRATDREMHGVFHLPHGTCGARLGTDAQKASSWSDGGGHRLASVEVRVNGRTTRHGIRHAAVVLCGVLHRGVHVATGEPYGFSRNLGSRWIWTADGLRAYAAEHDLELDEGRASTENRWVGNADPQGRRMVERTVSDLETWFAPLALDGRAREALVRERVTIASMNPLDNPPQDAERRALAWRIDQPTLAEMEFAKAVDPYTAFQEISMWKGGVLPSDGPAMVQITDDKVKIAKHGFHHPTSFRRAKAGG